MSQIRIDVNTLLGYAPSNQNAYAAGRAFINGRVDMASPKVVVKFIKENLYEAKEYVRKELSKAKNVSEVSVEHVVQTVSAETQQEVSEVSVEPALCAPETPSDTAQPDSMQCGKHISCATSRESKNKTKDKAIRGVEAQLIHIRDSENKRKAVWLEPEFCEALERITEGKDRAKWLSEFLCNVRAGNIASALRCAIVKELLKGK